MFLLKFGQENRGVERKFHVNGVYGLRPKRICDHNRLKLGKIPRVALFWEAVTSRIDRWK